MSAEDTQDVAAVAQLVLRERQARDRGRWVEMSTLFTADASIHMSWFDGPATEFIRQTQARSINGVWGRHRLGPPVVRVHGDRALIELPVGIEFRIDVDGSPGDLISYCRSQYRAQRCDRRWRLCRVTSIYERDTLTPALPGDHLPVDPAIFCRYRSSYACLAWYFDRLGSPLSDDLPGDDRPECTRQIYIAERAWLDGEAQGPAC